MTSAGLKKSTAPYSKPARPFSNNQKFLAGKAINFCNRKIKIVAKR